MIDSTPTPDCTDLIPLLDELGVRHWPLGAGRAFEQSTLRVLIDRGYFAGFDEIWLFREAPGSLTALPPRFTSDVGSLLPEPRIELEEIVRAAGLHQWMEVNGSVAGLGDGIGLNFATSDPTLSARLRNACE